MSMLMSAQSEYLDSGAKYMPETRSTLFTVSATPDAKQVTLRLYKDGMGGKPVKTVKTVSIMVIHSIVPLLTKWQKA